MQIGASYSLQFSLVMGCGREPSPHIDTQVRLEFSTNHGLTWHLVKEDCQPSSPLSSSVLSDFESQDALLATWQEVIGGEVVAPDMGCGVVSSGSSLYFSKMSVWLMLGNEGMERDNNNSFCAPTPSAMVFGRSEGDRVAVTRDLALRPGASAPVLLQYSHDAGRTWALVREGCYPGTPGTGVCEGSGRELREPTVYNTGDYEQWTRITVVIPRNVAAR
ncbi:hypothetical protein XENOCAPTIV_009038 [Xenoophorus captivus]|uniref:Reelin n=1 Tax=Xenoophorus captivus TaxID=1517983 RepID=A0ABV0QHA6_9TELE